jgi:hypothetical protein
MYSILSTGMKKINDGMVEFARRMKYKGNIKELKAQ